MTVTVEGSNQGLWQITDAGSAGFGAWTSVGGALTNGTAAAALLAQTANP